LSCEREEEEVESFDLESTFSPARTRFTASSLDICRPAHEGGREGGEGEHISSLGVLRQPVL